MIQSQRRWAAPPASNDMDLVEAMDKVAESLKTNVGSANALLERMGQDGRRSLAIAFIERLELDDTDDVEREFKRADVGRDGYLSPKEFEKWLLESFRRTGDTSSNELLEEPSRSVLIRISVVAAIPFVGFGFLDNAIMLLTGDLIDQTVGLYLHTSVMASAAMGNVVSGTIGMQVHGALDRAFTQLGFGMPPLSSQQQKLRSVFLAGHIGGTIGIALGLTLGMLPLLFIKSEDEKEAHRLFQDIDSGHDGLVDVEEILAALHRAGFSHVTREGILNQIKETTNNQYAKALTLAEFTVVYKSLLHGRDGS